MPHLDSLQVFFSNICVAPLLDDLKVRWPMGAARNTRPQAVRLGRGHALPCHTDAQGLKA